MKNIRLSCFFLPLAVMFSSNCAVAQGADDFVAAKLTDNLNSKSAKEVYGATRKEGWVYLSYIVGTDGKPKDVEVIGSSEEDFKVRDSKVHIRNLRYAPATFNGKPVESANVYNLRHSIGFVGGSNEGISPSFTEQYNKVRKLLQARDYKKAKIEIEELEENKTKNLAEQAFSAWLHSVYYAGLKNELAYLDSLQSAHRLRSYLSTKMAIENTQNLLRYQTVKNEYAEAVYTVYSMGHIEYAELDDATLKAMLDPLFEKINSVEPIIVETTLEKGLAWMHRLPRETISISYRDGKIEQAQLRCDNGYLQLSADKFKQFNIPPNYHSCALLIKGSAGTKVSVSETGKAITL